MSKIKIAVRMPGKSRRLYMVDDVGMAADETRAATLVEVPAVVLIGLPAPVPFLAPKAPT